MSTKRRRGELQDIPDELPTNPHTTYATRDAATGNGPSGPIKSVDFNFRSLSTCNRCRIRKNRCDQRLPTCASCEKVGATCTGYDPVTKKEIPRSYLHYLETRIATLETILDEHHISYPSPTSSLTNVPPEPSEPIITINEVGFDRDQEAQETLNTVVGSTGILPIRASIDAQDANCTSGISFARMAFSSVKSSVAASSNYRRSAVVERSWGNKSKSIKMATLPNRSLGLKLVKLYFQNSNPMYPILHRQEFASVFDKAYASEQCTCRELYILYIVFAIGAGIHLTNEPTDTEEQSSRSQTEEIIHYQPEEYHATAISHLDAFLSSGAGKRYINGLGELQAVLLLAAFALLRPAAPGLWYIIGVAVRRAVDLGLYSDDLATSTVNLDSQQAQVMLDFRRRLWWCVYSFDRLISTCVSRPTSFPDCVITTDFPSLLDDEFITPTGFVEEASFGPSYKRVAHHYFRLRLIQSEILQVLQAMQAQCSRKQSTNEHYHASPDPPFVHTHGGLEAWRESIDGRLEHWKKSAPNESRSGVSFPPEYFELNYWQTVIMLFRQNLALDTSLETELNEENAENPIVDALVQEEREQAFLRIAQAGQAVLRLYRELHLMDLVNYTFLDTHQLFTAGNAFLFAIWHSPTVQRRLSIAEIDLTVLAAVSVLTDLVEKCPHAGVCRDAFQKMSRATIKRCRIMRTLHPTSVDATTRPSWHSQDNFRQTNQVGVEEFGNTPLTRSSHHLYQSDTHRSVDLSYSTDSIASWISSEPNLPQPRHMTTEQDAIAANNSPRHNSSHEMIWNLDMNVDVAAQTDLFDGFFFGNPPDL